MTLIWLILILILGGLLAWLAERWNPVWSRWITLAALAIDLVWVLALWWQVGGQGVPTTNGPWLIDFNRPWIPQFGISFHFAMDGLSLLLLALTMFLGVMGVLASWTDIEERVGFFHFNLLWVLAGVTGVFVALDLFLFAFFWELMLVPMFILIAVWGHENRVYAATKFFLFTQITGLLMLISIVGLYFIHGRATGVYTFDYTQLLGTALTPSTAVWLMGGFAVAFLVKLPAVPLHTWLPDAHTEAPTAGSLILAGLLLKTGAYGLLRFVVPLFPTAVAAFAPVAMFLGAVSVLYGALLSFSQHDLKRLVAYTSVSHMGFVLLGIFARNTLAWQGVVLEMICHGISTGALFIIAGALQERLHTRDLRRMGGFWAVMPGMGAVALIFALASLGQPGLGNFVAEFLVLLGSYRASGLWTWVAVLGLIAAAIYALWMMQRTFYGPRREGVNPPDLSSREWVMMAALIVAIVWLGFYPQPVINTARATLDRLATNAQVAVVEIAK